MISNFKLFPNVNISQNFVQNVQKQKNTFVLSCPPPLKLRLGLNEKDFIHLMHKIKNNFELFPRHGTGQIP